MADLPLSSLTSSLGEVGSSEFIAARNAALANAPGPVAQDDLASLPIGHERGVRISTQITSGYRKLHRRASMDIQPGQVVEVIQQAGITEWVLMGLHGYVGYMHDPRATQDVDILVAHEAKQLAISAILKRWPQLVVSESEVVVRFKDPGELGLDNQPKPVIDVMLPWSTLHTEILSSQVVVDKATGHLLPTLEAALAAKYAAMVSPNRPFKRKQQDAVDFRILVACNHNAIHHESLCHLADLVWDGGSKEIVEFMGQAIRDEPFSL